jgi:hypothetical protein
MKHLKMLGLAAIAALGLMAFVGAGTASATTLSTDSAGTTIYGVGTVIHTTLKSGTSALLETTGGAEIAKCTESTTKGEIEIATGTWVGGALNTLNWGGCSQETVTINKGSIEIMQIGTKDEGEVRGKGSNVTLGVFGVSCTYGTGEGTTLGNLKGGTSAELVINAVLARSAGNTLLCPASGRWTATYIVTTPHAVHIVA